MESADSLPVTAKPIPEIVHRDGRHALLVDETPFLMLGVQCGNSSAWPAMLPKVWAAVEGLHANTLEIPIYWEQFEPEPGRFDYSIIDLLLAQAREHNVRLVLLWFGTYKNGSSRYMPLWMKRQPERYPRIVSAHGRTVDSPSPHAPATLEADKLAFAAFLRHLAEADPQRTVIMVQVENEPGSWGSVRDFSPTAQKLFEAPVPPDLLDALEIQPPSPRANWQEVFGHDADEFFHAWSVARFVGQVAEAGKAEYPLPLYTNAALRDPLTPGPASRYESGGPTDNVIPVWKAAAPALDLLAPDIYMSDSPRYLKVLELYGRTDNPLFIPETGMRGPAAKHFFSALGHQAIGFAPFGVDYTGYAASPLGEPRLKPEALSSVAWNYKLIGSAMRELARLSFEGRLRAIAEEEDAPSHTLEFDSWKATVSYGTPEFGHRGELKGNPHADGRALIASLGDDQFLVAGLACRVDFQCGDSRVGAQREFLRVEEGTYDDGEFNLVRIWNGDQTDWGLNFSSGGELLRVTLGTY